MATDKEVAAAVTKSETVTTNVLTVFSHAFAAIKGVFKQDVPKLEGEAIDVAKDLVKSLVPNAEAQNFFLGILDLGEKGEFTDLSLAAQSALHVGQAKAENILSAL